MAHHAADISKDNLRLGPMAGTLMIPALIVGVAGIALAVVFGTPFGEDPSRFFQGYLVAFMFWLAVSLGGLFFTLIHHATHAGWSSSVRRLAEALGAQLPWMLIFFLPLLYGLWNHDLGLWQWADSKKVAADPLLQHKEGYLNETFFLIRAAIYFFIWIVISRFFWSASVKQDQTGSAELSSKMSARSYPCIILFALTLTFAAFDWMMSQDAHWFSTIWGVYFFAAAMGSFLSLSILLFMIFQRGGRIRNSVTVEHYHDLGKLLFAFGMVFWAYIAFSQYMLQWYASLPEETLWWQARASGMVEEVTYHGHTFKPGAWNLWTLTMFVGHFCIPFVAVISRWPKRIKPLLAFAAVWMLIFCAFDIFWLLMPVFHPGHASVAISDIALIVGMGGLYIFLLINRLRTVSLVAEHDPRLNEALAFENI